MSINLFRDVHDDDSRSHRPDTSGSSCFPPSDHTHDNSKLYTLEVQRLTDGSLTHWDVFREIEEGLIGADLAIPRYVLLTRELRVGADSSPPSPSEGRRQSLHGFAHGGDDHHKKAFPRCPSVELPDRGIPTFQRMATSAHM